MAWRNAAVGFFPGSRVVAFTCWGRDRAGRRGCSLRILKVQKAKHVAKRVTRILFPPPRPRKAASVNPNIPVIRHCQRLGEKTASRG